MRGLRLSRGRGADRRRPLAADRRAGGLCAGARQGEFAAALKTLFLAPLLLPTLVIGLALLMFLQPLKLTATLTGLVCGHLVVTVPFVIRMMVTTFSTLPDEVEAAAASLGLRPGACSAA